MRSQTGHPLRVAGFVGYLRRITTPGKISSGRIPQVILAAAPPKKNTGRNQASSGFRTRTSSSCTHTIRLRVNPGDGASPASGQRGECAWELSSKPQRPGAGQERNGGTGWTVHDVPDPGRWVRPEVETEFLPR